MNANWDEAIKAAQEAGIGFTIQRPTRDTPGEYLCLTIFEDLDEYDDDNPYPMLACLGAGSGEEACRLIVEAAAEYKEHGRG